MSHKKPSTSQKNSNKSKKTLKKNNTEQSKATKTLQTKKQKKTSIPPTLPTPIQPVLTSQLKKYTDPLLLPKSSNQANVADVTFGQDRAFKAIKTALGIKANGYHVFAVGENGLGKRTVITRMLTEHAKNLPTPDDWVYVYNYDTPREPIAINLPAGQAKNLKNQVETIWLQASKKFSKRFRGDHYQTQVEAIKNDIHAKETEAYENLAEEGKKYNLELHFRPSDNKALFIDIAKNVTIDKTECAEDVKVFEKNDNISDKTEIEPKHNIRVVTDTIVKTTNQDTNTRDINNSATNPLHNNHPHKNHMLKRFNQLTIALETLEDEVNLAIEELHKNIAKRVLEPIITPVIEMFADQPEVNAYIQTIQDDMIRYVERIVNQDDEEFMDTSFSAVPARYCVNILATHEPDSGAPLVFEDLPTHLNLLGHVEQVTHLGTVTTDVSMIRAGSLHKANGGFLILEAHSLLEHPYAWQGLKRALQSKKIKLSSLEQMLTLTGSLSLSPLPIDLDIKVILLGEANLYYELIDFEPEFDAVFKIRADFQDDIKRNTDSEQAIVAKIADIAKDKALLPFNNFAMATIIDYLSLLTDEQNCLSLHADRLSQLLFESNRHAKIANAKQVSKNHVIQTITDMNERSNYLRDLYWHEVENGQQIINTRGYAIGQINALTVISYADTEFGMPARLTALIQPKIGHGEILDIERDVNLGGNLHAKGMLIQTSYLRSLFSQHHELNFSASLAFEQNYAHIDGDSATLAEACALMSALAEIPISQSLAITGSMNQLGEVQAIGGVNAKITGFYDTCVEQGLIAKQHNSRNKIKSHNTLGKKTDEQVQNQLHKQLNEQLQGVIIPKANINNLMLRDDIIEAVEKGYFVIYAINHLNEALQILTGLAIDNKTKSGKYQKKTLFGNIIKRLKSWEIKDDLDES